MAPNEEEEYRYDSSDMSEDEYEESEEEQEDPSDYCKGKHPGLFYTLLSRLFHPQFSQSIFEYGR